MYRKITYLIFDLDHTLYPKETGLFKRVEDRIKLYISKKFGVSLEKASSIRQRYVKEFGLTLPGLIKYHGIDPKEYLDFVQDIEISEFIKRDEELFRILSDIPNKKFIFTNGSEKYAKRVLSALGIEELFLRIFDIEFVEYNPKPSLFSYKKVLSFLDTEPKSLVFFDDLCENLKTASLFGTKTVLVGEISCPFAKFSIRDAKQVKKVIEEFEDMDEGYHFGA